MLIIELLFLNARSAFITTKRKAKKCHCLSEKKKISALSRTGSRKFWKHVNNFNSNNRCKAPDISPEDLFNYFCNVSNNPNDSSYRDTNDCNYELHEDIIIDSLDRNFSVDEICKTISVMSRYKSCDLSGNVADFFIDAKFYCSVFDVYFQSYI